MLSQLIGYRSYKIEAKQICTKWCSPYKYIYKRNQVRNGQNMLRYRDTDMDSEECQFLPDERKQSDIGISNNWKEKNGYSPLRKMNTNKSTEQ